MKEKTKEFLKKYLIGFVLGVVSAGVVIVYAETYFPSNDVTYDNKESGLVSTNVQGAIDELYTECTTIPAGDQIIEDAGLEKDPYECRYFFTGANPNNYVTFNDEKAGWRIISVECDGTIKIMRTTNTKTQNWDTGCDANWARPASLNTYLNSTYYNGLNSTAKSQIVSKDWSMGAVTANNNDLADQISDENATKWNGKIALITASEYIRTSSDKSNCGTLAQLTIGLSGLCDGASWMPYSTSDKYWWTLSRLDNTNTTSVFISYPNHYSFGVSSTCDTSIGEVLPVLYLSSDIKITGGDGSQSNPYILG